MFQETLKKVAKNFSRRNTFERPHLCLSCRPSTPLQLFLKDIFLSSKKSYFPEYLSTASSPNFIIIPQRNILVN